MGGAVAELHLDRAAVHEVKLLLHVVEVAPRFISGGHRDHVDAERAYAKALAHLAKAVAFAERVEVRGHCVALARGHLGVLRCLHVDLPLRDCQWSATTPPSGESGLFSAAQRTSPPSIDSAWAPDARNAWAAISERAPTRQ